MEVDLFTWQQEINQIADKLSFLFNIYNMTYRLGTKEITLKLKIWSKISGFWNIYDEMWERTYQ